MADEKITRETEASDYDHALTHQASAGLHHDHVAEEAIGGHTSDLPKGYYRSMDFIGTVIVREPLAAQHPGY
jgi:hypothetical protein